MKQGTAPVQEHVNCGRHLLQVSKGQFVRVLLIGVLLGRASEASSVNATAVALSYGSQAVASWCAVGATANGLASWTDSRSTELTNLGEALPVLGNSLGIAAHDLVNTASEILHGGSTPARQAALEETQSAHDAARAAHRNAVAAIRGLIDTAIVAQAGSDGLTLVQRMEVNAHRPVPDVFKCLDLSEDAWQTLQVALRKAEQGITLTADESRALAGANSNAFVQAATARIAMNGPAFEAWFVEHAHAAAASASGPAQ